MAEGAERRGMWGREPLAFLSSGGLAVGLLLLLILLVGASLALQQAGDGGAYLLGNGRDDQGFLPALGRFLGLHDVRHSGLLYAVCGIMAINLLLCLMKRLTAVRLLLRVPESPPSAIPAAHARTIPRGEHDPRSVAAVLRRRGYRTRIGENAVYGLRGRYAVLGHWVFHAALLLLLAVGSYVAAAPRPFRGVVGLGEGEPFDLHETPLLGASVPVTSDLPGLRFRLESIDVRTENEEVRRLEAVVTEPEGPGDDMAINRPFRRWPYQVMAHGFGYMPGWVIVDPDGRMLRGAWLKLSPFPSRQSDSFRIGAKTSEVTVRLYPNHQSTDGREHATVGHELANPRFLTRIILLEETIFDGLLAPGERVPLGNGREFFWLPEIRRYLLVDVIREREHHVIFAILALMVCGLAVRYFRLRKEILVQFGTDRLRISGRGELLEDLFEEEMERLSADLGRKRPTAPAVRRAIA